MRTLVTPFVMLAAVASAMAAGEPLVTVNVVVPTNTTIVVDAKAAAEADAGQNDPKVVVEEIIDKIRAAIKAGNVDRILIRRNDEILVNIPVNLGLVGSAIALTAAPGALIAAAIAAYGFSCKIEIVRKDGSNEEL